MIKYNEARVQSLSHVLCMYYVKDPLGPLSGPTCIFNASHGTMFIVEYFPVET